MSSWLLEGHDRIELVTGVSGVSLSGTTEVGVRVGLFLRNLDEEYQIQVFRGVRARARERGVDLVCVQGETLRPSLTVEDQPLALAHQIRFDGLLVLSSVILDAHQGPKASSIPSFLPSVPTLSMGLKIAGMPSVTIQAMRSLTRIMEHLVLDHGYRRFLFIGGPRNHRDTQIRERVFRRTLGEFSRMWPDIVAVVDHGGFSEVSGMEVIRRHFAEEPFDAVVAANDNMALGVQKLLGTHEDPRWQRCAVTGFDDTPQALMADPPLTSVHQPLDTLGSASFDALFALIQGRGRKSNRTIASTPIIRESCGCLPPPGPRWGRPDDHLGLATRLDAARRHVLETERWLRDSNDFGRDLSALTTRAALVERLDGFLDLLGVEDFLLVMEGRLGYERLRGVRSDLPREGLALTAEQLFSARPLGTGAPWTYCVFHLRSGGHNVGLAVYAVDDRALPHLGAVLPHVAHALLRIRNLAEQEDRNRQLETMVAVRTHELTRVNQSLREEVERRRAAEAEVLQISEFERRRFGLDLHDDICQRLAGLTMYLRGVAKRPPEDPRPAFLEAGAMVDETLELTRQYSHASFPIELEQRGLDAVLKNLCETVTARTGCPCRYRSTLRGPGEGPHGLAALNIYRIVQEALQNCLKHSRARQIEVTLEGRGDEGRELVLTIADNGSGLPPEKEGAGGLGFRSMAYRASQLGARFDLSSRPGVGTVVTVALPRHPLGNTTDGRDDEPGVE